MLTISAFAQMAGLSAKTLRYYHDRGLLVPSRVAPDTGYRSYTFAQLDDAIQISVLRRGGMPIEQIREVLDNPDRAETLIRAFHDEVRRRRQAEDEALEHMANAASRKTVATHTRTAAALPYAAITVRMDAALDTEPDTAVTILNERVDEQAEWLRQRLVSADATPTGEFWTVLGSEGDALTVTVHWPLPDSADPAECDSIAEGIRCGQLPDRVESFSEVPRPEQDGDALILLAMSTVLSTAGHGVADVSALRQTVHRERSTVEYALTLREEV